MKIGFDKNYQIIGDLDFFVRFSKENLFECLQDPLATFRIHKNNFTCVKMIINLYECYDII